MGRPLPSRCRVCQGVGGHMPGCRATGQAENNRPRINRFSPADYERAEKTQGLKLIIIGGGLFLIGVMLTAATYVGAPMVKSEKFIVFTGMILGGIPLLGKGAALLVRLRRGRTENPANYPSSRYSYKTDRVILLIICCIFFLGISWVATENFLAFFKLRSRPASMIIPPVVQTVVAIFMFLGIIKIAKSLRR